MADIINVETIVDGVTIVDPETTLAITITEECVNAGESVDIVTLESNLDNVTISTDDVVLQINEVIESLPLVDSTVMIQVVEDSNVMYAKRINFVDASNLIYRGEAAVGSADTDPVWRIRRFTINPLSDDDITEEWSGGTADFDKVWSDHLIGVYS